MNDFKVPILITGGTGFIGSHLVRRLLTEGSEVHIIGRKEGPNLGELLNEVHIHKIDITNYSDVAIAVKKIMPKKIFHIAASTNKKKSLEGIEEVVNTNIYGTTNLMRALDNIDYDVLVFTGSCEEYGTNNPPFTENQTENPTSIYSWSKTSIALLFRMLNNTGKNKMVILRPSVVYGPNQKTNALIPYTITSALTGKKLNFTKGEQTRDFVFVSDIVEGYMKAATVEDAKGKIINLGAGKEYKVKYVVKKILELMGTSAEANFGAIPERKGEIQSYLPNISLANSLLKWQPRVSLEEGLRKTIEWYSEKFEKNELERWSD